MDQNAYKEFMSSGRTLITDTMAVKSILPKPSKNEPKLKEMSSLNPLENLINRMKDEKPSKKDVIDVFQKIIDQKESEI